MKYTLFLIYLLGLVLPSPAQKTAIEAKEKFLRSRISASRLDSFIDILSHSDVFVDKSLFIKEFLELNRKVVLITRPQGWGKSVNLDMLRVFFSNEVDDAGIPKPTNKTRHFEIFRTGGYTFHGKYEKLERLLLISGCSDIMDQHLGKYPVIHVRFARLRGNNFRMLLTQIRDVIAKAFREHSYMTKILDRYSRDNATTNSKKYRMSKHANLFRKFLHDDKTSLDRIQKSLQFLSKVLREQFHKPPIIIMDDYDLPLRHMFLNDSFPKDDTVKFITFYTNFIQTTFKHNTYIDKGILGGNLRLLNDTLFPIGKKEGDVDDEFPDFFGFTEDELKGMCERYEISDIKRAKAREWYYGYEASKRNPSFVYNPWSIAHFVKEKKIKDYWIDRNDAREYLEAFLQFDSFREKFVSLVYRNNITMNPKNLHFNNDDFMQLQNFMRTKKREKFSAIVANLALSFLWSHGYLTTVHDLKTNILRLRIPNTEIGEYLRKHLVGYYRDELGVSDKKDLQGLLEEFKRFVDNDEVDDPVLKEHFRNFFRIRSKKVAKSKAELGHALLNYLVLYADSYRRFGSEGLNKDIPDAKLIKDNRAIIIEFVWDTEAKIALEKAKKNEKLFYKNIEIKLMKFIGICFKVKGNIEMVTEVVDNPFIDENEHMVRSTSEKALPSALSNDTTISANTSSMSDASDAYSDQSDTYSGSEGDVGDSDLSDPSLDDYPIADDASYKLYDGSGDSAPSVKKTAKSIHKRVTTKTTKFKGTSTSISITTSPPITSGKPSTPLLTKSLNQESQTYRTTFSKTNPTITPTTLIKTTLTTVLTSDSSSKSPSCETSATKDETLVVSGDTEAPRTKPVDLANETTSSNLTSLPSTLSSSVVYRRTRARRTKPVDLGNETISSNLTTLSSTLSSSIADLTSVKPSRRTRIARNSSSVSRRTRVPKTQTTKEADSNN